MILQYDCYLDGSGPSAAARLQTQEAVTVISGQAVKALELDDAVAEHIDFGFGYQIVLVVMTLVETINIIPHKLISVPLLEIGVNEIVILFNCVKIHIADTNWLVKLTFHLCLCQKTND